MGVEYTCDFCKKRCDRDDNNDFTVTVAESKMSKYHWNTFIEGQRQYVCEVCRTDITSAVDAAVDKTLMDIAVGK